MRKMLLSLFLAISSFALIACGIESGKVDGKKFIPAYDIFRMQCQYANNNACGIQIPVFDHYDECWELYLTAGDDDGTVCVSKLEYDSYNIGEHYPRGK
jgi:hypothetical protein